MQPEEPRTTAVYLRRGFSRTALRCVVSVGSKCEQDTYITWKSAGAGLPFGPSDHQYSTGSTS